MQNLKNVLYRAFPALGVLFALLVQTIFPDSPLHPAASRHYYNFLLYILLSVTVAFFALSFCIPKIREALVEKGAFFLGAGALLSSLNLVTAKFALLPVIFFPTFDNILAVFVEQTGLLLKCIGFSFRLLILGVIWGTIAGFITGVCLGFSKKVYYWINPYIKLIGPIPAPAWIPLVLTTFPTPLGAGTFFQIFKIAVPAALPNIFQGVFNGICAAFIALMTAEMFGAKYGIGWYISYQKAMMLYSGVYAGLLMIAVFCTVIITALFKIRSKVLNWQKGLIKW